MSELKFAAGVWFLGATGDRFVKSGYRDDRSMEERFRLAASIEGISGLEMVEQLKPPLILLDIGLPGMSGLEVVGRIKADDHLRKIPVIALTASAMRGDRERFLAAGCDDYLSKPVRAMELINMVAAHYPSSNGKIN